MLKKYQRHLIRVTRRQIIINAFEKSRLRRFWSKESLIKTIEALEPGEAPIKVRDYKINYIVERAVLARLQQWGIAD